MTKAPENSDAEFARSLLEAGRRDPSEPDVGEAWSHLAERLRLTVCQLETGSGLHARTRPEVSSTHKDGEVAQQDSGSDFQGAPQPSKVRLSPVHWTGLGAVCGSGLTLALLGAMSWFAGPVAEGDNEGPEAVVRGFGGMPVAGVPAVSKVPDVSPDPSVAAEAPGPEPISSSAPRALPPHAGRVRASAVVAGSSKLSNQAKRGRSDRLGLADEVRLLDRARQLSAEGQASEALGLLHRYPMRFPTGELAREAEVLTIKVMVQMGRTDAAARRARAFLVEHSKDPHVAAVREWAAPRRKASARD